MIAPIATNAAIELMVSRGAGDCNEGSFAAWRFGV
jgi:hypothetical protein